MKSNPSKFDKQDNDFPKSKGNWTTRVVKFSHKSIQSNGQISSVAVSLKIVKWGNRPKLFNMKAKGLDTCPEKKNLVRTVKDGDPKQFGGYSAEIWCTKPLSEKIEISQRIKILKLGGLTWKASSQ